MGGQPGRGPGLPLRWIANRLMRDAPLWLRYP